MDCGGAGVSRRLVASEVSMSKKHFSWLLAATLVVAAVLLLLPGKTGKESALEPRPLVPTLAERVNDISRVRITRAGNLPVATLVRKGEGWVVEEAQSYPADWARLKGLLVAVAQAQVIEPKTSNPAYFDQLGLVDVDQEGSTALMVEIGEGEDAVNLLLGQVAQGRDGQYVRFAGTDQALLIDRTVETSAEMRDWLDREVIDLSEAEVVEVTLTHPDGEQLSVRKVSADDEDFTLQDIPPGRKIQSSWSVNSVGGGFADLQLDEVTPDSKVDWSKSIKVRVLTADGLEIKAELAKSGETAWLRLSASSYAPETAPATETGDEQAATEPGPAIRPESEERAETINRRVSGWAYALPEFKAQALSKRREDLLAPAGAD
jgi:hypothetical protein